MRLRFNIKYVFIAVFVAALIAAVLGKRYHSFQRQHFAARELQGLGGDVELSLEASAAWFDSPLRIVFDDSKLGNYFLAQLRDSKEGLIGSAHFVQLESLPYLRHLHIDLDAFYRPLPSLTKESEMVDRILSLPHLESVSFGYQNISMASHDRLGKAGLQVSHLGIADFRLEKNFIRLEKNDAFVDLNKSGLYPTIDAGSNQVSWWIELKSKGGQYVSKGYENSFLKSTLEIPNKVGETIQNSEAKTYLELVEGENWFYYGQHCSACDIRVRLVSQTGHSLHLDFDFVAALIESDFLEPEKQGRVEVNAELDVRSIVVQFGNENDVDETQAKKLLEKHGLDPNHYSVQNDSGDSSKIVFAKR